MIRRLSLIPALAAGAVLAVGALASTAALAGDVTSASVPSAEPTEGSVFLKDGVVRPQTVKEVGGGTWNYGTTVGAGWSNYYHTSKCHGSSAYSGSKSGRDHNVRPGKESQVHIWRDGTNGVEAYWTNTGSC